MYTFRLIISSLLIFLLTSCQNEIPAQTFSKTKSTEKNEDIVQKPIITGAEQLDEIIKLTQNKKVGVIANQTSVVKKTHLVDTLLSRKVAVKKVFSPEHGFRGDADAGEQVSSNHDEKTDLPIVSLYGNNKKPTVKQLEDIEVLIFDLQDVGTRFYTYISTLHYAMEAAGENQIELMVLDRPNPNGGYVDGPIRKKGFESFVGLDPIPIVHGMTVGELAQMMNGEGWLKNEVKCDLTIISCKNYNRNMAYSLPISPSPNLRSDEAIQLYPSLCLFEGTILSVGRGTETPFELFGHPDLKNDEKYTFSFTPQPSYGAKNPKLNGKKCFGLNLHAFANNNQIKQIHIQWIIDSYQALNRSDYFDARWFDLLAGTDQLRKQIIAGKSEKEIRSSWEKELEEFKQLRTPYLLYE